MKNIKQITDGDVIELAKLIKTNDWDNSKEVTYWEKFQNEPFYEMFTHCKSYAVNSIYYNKDVWDFLTQKGYDIGEFKVRP
jgi:hypothetical protein